MAKQLSILFVSSEVYPFAKVSGIADVSYSLPLALRDLGHDVRVMMPKYGSISERKNRIHEINRLRDIPIPMGEDSVPATVKSSSINNPRNKVQAYITTNEKYFDSKRGIYNDPKTWKPYADNDERFIFFNRSVIETCLMLGWYPDIIHCNNWQTSLIAAYAKQLFPKEFKKTKIVLTIHNFSDQGVFPLSTFDKTGLPKKAQPNFRFKNKFNFIKGGIINADWVTTVSPSYADQMLKDKTHSNGLSAALKENEAKFSGILNGIDTWTWSPEHDNLIVEKFEDDYSEYKYQNKTDLLEKFGLEFDPDFPVLGVVSRIDEQKGIPLLLEAAKEFLKLDVQLVMLGDGEPKLREKLKKLSAKYPDKFKIKFGFNDQLAHQIEAGTDMYLLPSEFEPCGLNLPYSLNYGSVPIVHATGGLKDVAKNYDPKTKKGNAFVFKNYDAKDFVAAIKNALNIYTEDRNQWEQIAKNGMDGDYSWEKSAEKYDEIYFNLLKD
ncbi:MAG: glycogen synthase [Candidatus Kapaibacterium sp.]